MNQLVRNHTKIAETGKQNPVCFPDGNHLLQTFGSGLWPGLRVYGLDTYCWPAIRQELAEINRIIKTTQGLTGKTIAGLPPVRLLWPAWRRIDGCTARFIPGAARINS
jgi:hypothetical protein